MNNNKYERLDEITENSNIPSTTLNPILEMAETPSKLSIRLICKEKSHELKISDFNMKVSELKPLVSEIFGCPIDSLRLIFNGKLLVDSKTLLSFGIQDHSCIHVFPKPNVLPDQYGTTLPVATNPSTSSQNINNVTNALPLTSSFVIAENAGAHNHQPIQFDPTVSRTGREVKIWSYILLITSSYRLFGLLADMAARGGLGVDWLDAVVQVIDTLCCSAGLYVGHLGVKSAQLIEIATVRKYVLLLCILAAVNIVLQAIWVADVVHIANEMHRAQKDNNNKGHTPGGDNPPSDNGDNNNDGGGTQPGGAGTIDDQAVAILGVQAFIIASIVTSVWFSCVMRARRFRDAVQYYDFEQRAVSIIQASTVPTASSTLQPTAHGTNTTSAPIVAAMDTSNLAGHNLNNV